MRFILKNIITGILLNITISAYIKAAELRVIASGESHGMVEGCECIHEPGGGIARRSFVIKSLGNRNEILVVDAGGFAAGDMYDSYTEGRIVDSIRTVAMIKGMGLIGYDAVAIGDDDLQYGGKWLIEQARKSGLPLISANCYKKDGQLLTKPFVLVKKGNVTYGITAVTSDEGMVSVDNTIEIRDPYASIEKIWKQLTKKSDIQIILSHLGNDMSSALAEKFTECDLIVNGHRKNNNDPLYHVKNTPVMQFGFQGKSISDASFNVNGNTLKLLKNNWIQIHQNLPEDTVVAKAVRYTSPPKCDVYDLYIMSHCPYGIEALADFIEFQKSFKNIQWEIRFIGTLENKSEFKSLHGDAEIQDEMLWLAIKELYPEKWVDFLTIRSKMPVPAYGIPPILDFDENVISKWVHEYGKVTLSRHYIRSSRLAINASPTLLKNNLPFDKKISKIHLARETCSQNGNSSTYCDSVPVCIDNSDCKRKGMIGKCEADTCVYKDAIKFTFTALVNDSLEGHQENPVIATTEELFPGAEINKISIHTEQGKKLIKNWEFPPLPFYLFGKEVANAPNFNSIESGVVPFFDGFTFKKGVVSRNYFPVRNEIKGKVIFFVDPFFQGINSALNIILNDSAIKGFDIYPILLNTPEKVSPGTIDQFRQDEALRWLVINKYFNDKMSSYLNSYIKNYGNSFWYSNIKNAGISLDSISSIIEEFKDELLFKNFKFIDDLEIKDPLVVLIDNRKLVIVKNENELKQIISGNTK